MQRPSDVSLALVVVFAGFLEGRCNFHRGEIMNKWHINGCLINRKNRRWVVITPAGAEWEFGDLPTAIKWATAHE